MSNPVADVHVVAESIDSSEGIAGSVAGSAHTSPPSLVGFRPGLCPELGKSPYNAGITLWTLETLGFKRSEQAEAAGYLCVIPYSSGGYRSFPARWVAPGDLGLLAGLIEEINS